MNVNGFDTPYMVLENEIFWQIQNHADPFVHFISETFRMKSYEIDNIGFSLEIGLITSLLFAYHRELNINVNG